MERKPWGYWRNKENFLREVNVILKQYNGTWPGTFWLHKNRSDLENVIRHRYGGLKKFNKDFNFKTKRPPHNEYGNKFVEWSDNLAYFIGFVVTDGHLEKRSRANCICLKLAETDKEILFKFHKWLGLKNSISIQQPGPPKKYQDRWITTKQRAFKLIVFGKQPYNFLVKIGVAPHDKTHLQKSLRIPNQYFSHFLRGVIDGDGSITINSSKSSSGKILSYLRIQLLGTKKFLVYIKEMVNKCLDLKNKTQFINKMGNIFQVRWNGKDALKIRDFLYRDASLFLKRKRKTGYKIGGQRT